MTIFFSHSSHRELYQQLIRGHESLGQYRSAGAAAWTQGEVSHANQPWGARRKLLIIPLAPALCQILRTAFTVTPGSEQIRATIARDELVSPLLPSLEREGLVCFLPRTRTAYSMHGSSSHTPDSIIHTFIHPFTGTERPCS